MKSVMLVYNLFQAVFNSWLFYKVWWLWRDHYDWNCQPVDYTYRSAQCTSICVVCLISLNNVLIFNANYE